MAEKKLTDTKHWLRAARTISEALPFMRRYSGRTFVIKYGGHAMGDAELAGYFARDIVLLKQVGINPIIVHGGGPQIGRMLERLQIQTSFVEGLRVTDETTVEVVEMVLAGSINKQIVSDINAAGGTAIGLSGKDGHMIRAGKLHRRVRDSESNIERVLDLGFVGEPETVDPRVLSSLESCGIIPVIAPIGVGAEGETYNINADTVAGAVAAAVGATRLLLLTDVIGVLDEEGQLIPELNPAEVARLIAAGTISGGMIPKIETCLHAVEKGVGASVILDGRVAHSILLEIFTDRGFGTRLSAQ
jgi:acetylglutamate kinase